MTPINYSIGQGDTLVTPIQMATIYAAIANGGTLYDPTVGKAIVSADGKPVEEIKPKSHGKLPMDAKTLNDIDEALAGVATRGTAAWRFGGWPQDKIPMHAKTGTAEVYGKQTTSWFATYTKDYTIVMTISQGGTGSGASGPAVRKIYDAMYGLDEDGKQDLKKALLPKPAEDPAQDPARRLDRRPDDQAVRARKPSHRQVTRREHATRPRVTREAMTDAPASPSPGTAPSAVRLGQAHRPRLRRAPARLAAALLRPRAVLHRLAAGLLGDPRPRPSSPTATRTTSCSGTP